MPKIPVGALIVGMFPAALVPAQPNINSATAFSRLSATECSRLSETAQNLIVNYVLGLPTPADIPDSVRAEIQEWVNTDETPPDT